MSDAISVLFLLRNINLTIINSWTVFDLPELEAQINDYLKYL